MNTLVKFFFGRISIRFDVLHERWMQVVCRGCVRLQEAWEKKKKERFPSMCIIRQKVGMAFAISRIHRTYLASPSLHSFPRWLILTTNRSVLEILSLEAYQNVRNVLRLIAPQIHLSRMIAPFVVCLRISLKSVSSSSGSLECEYKFLTWISFWWSLRCEFVINIYCSRKVSAAILYKFMFHGFLTNWKNWICLKNIISVVFFQFLINIQLSYE